MYDARIHVPAATCKFQDIFHLPSLTFFRENTSYEECMSFIKRASAKNN